MAALQEEVNSGGNGVSWMEIIDGAYGNMTQVRRGKDGVIEIVGQDGDLHPLDEEVFMRYWELTENYWRELGPLIFHG